MAASDRERGAFVALTVLLCAAMLLPIWCTAFPPLQDYPYHLAQVAVLLAGDGPGSPYAAHFTVDLAPRPYAAFHLLATTLARALPLEVAGRVALSVPALLWGGLLLGGARRRGAPPWGALVLLPLSTGLSYYLGFLPYLWSLPLLGLALEDLARVAEGERVRRSGLRLAVWIGGLFLTHPFTFLAFLGLGALRWLCDAPLPGGRRRAAAFLAAAAAGFAVWYGAADAGRAASGPEGVHWLPIGKSFELATLPFLGMRGGGHVAPLGVWIALAGVLAHAAWGSRRDEPRSHFWEVALVLLLIATFASPFRMGHYSYINARIPELAFLCLGMGAGGLRFAVPGRVALVALVAAAIALSGMQQWRVARELVEVAPLLERIPAGASVLPLVFDDDSPELESSAFDPHLHVHHYFHVRRGGGVTPYFFPHPLAPVRYRAGSPPPAPPQLRPGAYRADLHGGYAYLLTRTAPPRFLGRLRTVADEIGASGPWRLFRRRGAGSARELEEPPAGNG